MFEENNMNNKKIFLIFGILTLILLIAVVKSILTTTPEIIGDSIIYNTSKFYFNITPETQINDGFVEYIFMSKTFSGDIDMALGFNKDKVNLAQIQYFNPHFENITKSYSCDNADNFVNFTTNPNHFWCYRNDSWVDNSTLIMHSNDLVLIKNHSFINGSLVTKTAYWQEMILNDWSNLNKSFNTINYTYDDKDTWKYATGINIQVNQTYRFRIYLDSKINPFASEKIKYDFAIKPSSKTIQQSISDGTFYLLDPTIWSQSLDSGLFAYYNMSSDLEQYQTWNLTKNGDSFSATSPNCVHGKCGLYDATKNWSVKTTTLTNSHQAFAFQQTQNFTINFWYDPTSNDNADTLMSFYDSANQSNGYIVYKGSNNFISVLLVGATLATSNVMMLEANGIMMVTVTQNSSGSLCIYLNATSDSACKAYIKINDTSDDFFKIGDTAHHADTNTPAQGYFDEIAFWNRSLSASEIATLFNDSNGITRDDDVSAVPIVTLISPSNNSLTNHSFVLNCSGDKNEGTELNNVTFRFWNSTKLIINSTNFSSSGDTNSTTLNHSFLYEGNFEWNCKYDNTNSGFSYAVGNFTIIANNTEQPSGNITEINTTAGSQTIDFAYNTTDNFPSISSCFYTLTNSTGEVDASTTANTSFTCGNSVSETLSNFGGFNLTIYSNDSSRNNNLNWTREEFTLSASAGGGTPAGGGGGGGTGQTITTVVALKNLENASAESNLSRAKLYSRIFELNLSKNQVPTIQQKGNLVFILNKQNVKVDNQTIELWIENYKLGKVENVKVFLQDQVEFNLVSAEVKIIPTKFAIVSPTNFDKFAPIISDKIEISTIIQLNKQLKECKILENSDVGWSCESQGSIAIVRYLIPESFRNEIKVVKSKISYTSQDDENAFQDAQIRLFPITLKLVFTILVPIGIFGFIFIYRKKIVFKLKIQNRKKR